ncbi:hypothetical protein WJX82_005258 [Trebouxia sp. C0006]
MQTARRRATTQQQVWPLRCAALHKPPTPDSPEVKEYKATVDTVIELLNTEAELIETGQAPNGSATNVNLIIHDLLPNLAQQRLQPTTNRHQLLEKNWELCLLADLLKGTQKEYKVVDKSLSDLEEEDEKRDTEIFALAEELAFLTARQVASRGVLIKRKSLKEQIPAQEYEP